MLALQLTLTGLQAGALYALTAVGFSLIFGSTRVFHFAHGATFALAAYLFYAVEAAGYGFVPGLLASFAGAIAFGLAIDWFIYRPIQRDEGSFFTVFVASFGIGIVVQNLIGMIFGRSFVTITSPLSRSREILDGVYVAPLAGIAFVVALICLVALGLFLRTTFTGKGLRALSDDPELVRVFGLNPRYLSAAAFAIGSALVVPAAVFTSMSSGLNPAIGHHVMLISLAATIVGGIGSIPGTMIAAFIFGLAENLSLLWFEPQWSEAVVFAILFAAIIARPSGLMGKSAAR